MTEQQADYKLEERELKLEDFQEYFVLDDVTGDLYVRTDLRDHLKELKGEKVWLLLKIMFFNPSLGDDEEEHLKDIERFENGKGMYYRIRREYSSMRDALMIAIIQRDGNTCRHCGTDKNITIDHIEPVVKGGRNLMSNLQLLCKSCNSKKGAK